MFENECSDSWANIVFIAPWERLKPQIKRIVVEEGVTSISDGAFFGCMLAESISLPKSVKRIGYDVFSGCASLRSIDIPEGAELKDLFLRCLSLEEINVIGSNPYCRSEDGVLFSRDGELLRYPPGRKGDVYRIPDGTKVMRSIPFLDVKHLKHLILPEGITCRYPVTNRIPEVTIPASMTEIRNVPVPLKAYHVSEGNKAFKAVDGLLYSRDGKILLKCPLRWERTVFDVPDDLEEIPGSVPTEGFRVSESNSRFRAIDGVLFSKDGKTLVSYPERREGEIYEIPEGTEEVVGELVGNIRTLVIPDSFDGGYYSDSSLENILVKGSNEKLSSKDGVLFSKDGTVLKYYPPNRGDREYTVPEGVRSIGEMAFCWCPDLETVNMPESLETLSETAFIGCENLRTVRLHRMVEIEKAEHYPNELTDPFPDCELLGFVIDGEIYRITGEE